MDDKEWHRRENKRLWAESREYNKKLEAWKKRMWKEWEKAPAGQKPYIAAKIAYPNIGGPPNLDDVY
jgi:hypothetical protein